MECRFVSSFEQPNLDAPVAKIQLAATADPKIRFGLAMGSLRCLLLLILLDGTPDTEAGMMWLYSRVHVYTPKFSLGKVPPAGKDR